jgi:hypothetical protein
VDDVSAGEVHDTGLEKEPVGAPEAERPNEIRGEPERDEEHPLPEVDAAEKRAGDEDERDGGEYELEEEERRGRVGAGEALLRKARSSAARSGRPTKGRRRSPNDMWKAQRHKQTKVAAKA